MRSSTPPKAGPRTLTAERSAAARSMKKASRASTLVRALTNYVINKIMVGFSNIVRTLYVDTITPTYMSG